MDRDDGLEPRLGRIGRDGKAMSLGREFRNRAIKAANLARGGRVVSGKPSAFTGQRIGRGSGAGAVLASRDGAARFGHRRVMVKARIVKLAGKGRGAAIAHMRYIQRDGVTRSGERGELYDGRSDVADGRAFLERAEGDRHQFRFIVSPEDGQSYDELRSVTRRLMSQMETDLGTKLDWVAADHFNTGHPHTHILIRGKDDLGKDLIMARNYITDGVRERASDIVSFDLGPRTEREVSQSLQREVTADRYTTIDRWILERRETDGRIRSDETSPERQSLITGRLKHLERLELATSDTKGHWQVSDDLEPALRQLGRRGDIINSLRYDLNPDGQGHLLERVRIHDADPSLPHAKLTEPIVGRLVRRGLYDEIEDRHFLVIDAVDGHTHVLDIGKGESTPHIGDNSILRLAPKVPQISAADHTIAKVAAANGGRYSVELHLRTDPNAHQHFAEAHVRRLEAVRKGTGAVSRDANGMFRVGDAYRETALAYERQKAAQTPVRIDVLSPEPLKALERRNAWTWLDKELTAADRMVLAETGFGEQVQQSLVRRQNWMIEQGLIKDQGNGTLTYSANLERHMAARELKAEGDRLAQHLGKAYGQMKPYEEFRGIVKDKISLNSGDYALVERAKDFALVPWRDVLERQRGREIGGMQHSNGRIEWSLGRDRGRGIE